VQKLHGHGNALSTEHPIESVHKRITECLFNLSTCIRYDLRQPATIEFDVLDLQGRQVAHLWSGFCEAGIHETRWDATNTSSGMYLCRLTAGKEISLIKMLLLK
jgi:hypothetical protein